MSNTHRASFKDAFLQKPEAHVSRAWLKHVDRWLGQAAQLTTWDENVGFYSLFTLLQCYTFVETLVVNESTFIIYRRQCTFRSLTRIKLTLLGGSAPSRKNRLLSTTIMLKMPGSLMALWSCLETMRSGEFLQQFLVLDMDVFL